MRWILYFFLSLPVAALGVAGGLWIGSRCVSWYRISSFEGGSGYFVIGIGLLGGMVGLITGLVTAGILGPQEGAGYLRAFFSAVGILVGLAVVTTGLCWVRADIPPQIDGRPLRIEVELRLPVGVTNSPVVGSGDSKLELTSLAHQTGRASETGELRVKEARFEYRQTVEEVLAEHRGEKINRLAAGVSARKRKP